MWPFPDWAGGSAIEVVSNLAAMGPSIIDARAPDEIVVSVDPAIGAPSPEDRVECSPENPLDVCAGFFHETRLGWLDLSLAKEWGQDLGGQSVLLEIVPGAEMPIARMFVDRNEDFWDSEHPLACEPFGIRATSGTLRLSSIDFSAPEEIHGVLEATLEGGHSLVLRF